MPQQQAAALGHAVPPQRYSAFGGRRAAPHGPRRRSRQPSARSRQQISLRQANALGPPSCFASSIGSPHRTITSRSQTPVSPPVGADSLPREPSPPQRACTPQGEVTSPVLRDDSPPQQRTAALQTGCSQPRTGRDTQYGSASGGALYTAAAGVAAGSTVLAERCLWIRQAPPSARLMPSCARSGRPLGTWESHLRCATGELNGRSKDYLARAADSTTPLPAVPRLVRIRNAAGYLCDQGGDLSVTADLTAATQWAEGVEGLLTNVVTQRVLQIAASGLLLVADGGSGASGSAIVVVPERYAFTAGEVQLRPRRDAPAVGPGAQWAVEPADADAELCRGLRWCRALWAGDEERDAAERDGHALLHPGPGSAVSKWMRHAERNNDNGALFAAHIFAGACAAALAHGADPRGRGGCAPERSLWRTRSLSKRRSMSPPATHAMRQGLLERSPPHAASPVRGQGPRDSTQQPRAGRLSRLQRFSSSPCGSADVVAAEAVLCRAFDALGSCPPVWEVLEQPDGQPPQELDKWRATVWEATEEEWRQLRDGFVGCNAALNPLFQENRALGLLPYARLLAAYELRHRLVHAPGPLQVYCRRARAAGGPAAAEAAAALRPSVERVLAIQRAIERLDRLHGDGHWSTAELVAQVEREGAGAETAELPPSRRGEVAPEDFLAEAAAIFPGWQGEVVLGRKVAALPRVLRANSTLAIGPAGTVRVVALRALQKGEPLTLPLLDPYHAPGQPDFSRVVQQLHAESLADGESGGHTGDGYLALADALLLAEKFSEARRAWRDGAAALPQHPRLQELVRRDESYWPFADAGGSLCGVDAESEWPMRKLAGADVWETERAMLPAAVCAQACEAAERAAEVQGGWTTTRHANVPTTDLPLHSVPELQRVFNILLRDHIAPVAARLFPHFVPTPAALRVHDAFVVRYDACGGQVSLPRHRDQSELSLTVALNSTAECDGGGTHFELLAGTPHATARPDAGNVVFFAGSMYHRAAAITRGRRYVIAAFLYGERAASMTKFQP
eukprot:TRINITY_DN21053_c0_g1_i1.p1 TRINITY_DN21053_c0_g1~~TRINITY_DN21053_c0_g1_i1.p1  ORF type:complete len:1024 (+),score=186.07 TRINITY_DN21053_c0_g1_i1:62-3133(+)